MHPKGGQAPAIRPPWPCKETPRPVDALLPFRYPDVVAHDIVDRGWGERDEGLATAFACDAVTGETQTQDQQDTVDRFQTDPLVRVLCGNIRAGGVGITLTAASDVLFAELDWNPGVHEQAGDRVNRIGQVNVCTAWYFLAQATIDQDIHALIEARRGVVTAGTDGDVVTGSHVVGMLASGVARRVAAFKDRTR